MKNFTVAACLVAGLFFANLAAAESLISVAHEGIRFSESVYPHDGGLFISNYGSENMRPRADENAGYIIFRKNGTGFSPTGSYTPSLMGIATTWHFGPWDLSAAYSLTGNQFFIFQDMFGGYGPADFKKAASSGIAYKSFDSTMPSLRYMSMRQGVEDLK